MLIRIGQYTLVDGTRENGVGIRWRGYDVTRGVEIVALIEAWEVVTRDRGNDATTVSFEVSRMLPSVEAANLFILDHEEDVPRVGRIQFVTRDANGGETVRYLREGRVQRVQFVEQIGKHVTFAYTFVGARFTARKPAA